VTPVEPDLVDNSIDVKDVRLVEFNFGEVSVVFDPENNLAWLEYDLDEVEDIPIEGPGLLSEDTLSTLPPLVREDGNILPLTFEEFSLMRSLAAAEVREP
jgi:hypothetical protein